VDDLNGDGKPDIVAANCVSSNCGAGQGQVGVLLNTSLTPTATALTSSPNPSKFGQTVTLTATVTDLPGFDKNTPTGTVTFSEGSTNIGNSPLNGSGVATLTTSTLAVGTDNITAAYSGDTNFVTSTSPAVQQVVQSAQGATSTALTLSSGTVAVGSSVTLTAKVSAGTGTPPDGEIVTFEDVTKTPTALGTGKLSKGTAVFTSTAIPAGAYSVVASYPGDANFLLSTSTPAQTLNVQGAPTITSLALSSGTVAFGTSVTLTAKVSSGGNTPPDGETVTFSSGAGKLGTGTLSKGTATFTSTTIPAGTYSVVASYPGDTDFLASTSKQQTLDVQDFKLAASPTTVTISGPGQSGSTTITITPEGNLKPSNISFACSGLPAKSQCTFGTVNSSDQVSLSITTTAASALRWPVFGHHQQLFYAILLPGVLGVVSTAGKRRTLRGLRLLALTVVLGLPALWLACGGGGSGSTTPPPSGGTPVGNSTVTVSATSGTLQHSITITVKVQ